MRYCKLPHQSNSKSAVVFHDPDRMTFTICTKTHEIERAYKTAARYPEYGVFPVMTTYERLVRLNNRGDNLTVVSRFTSNNK